MGPPMSAAVPPSLPPSVEEAYRRKCIQLKQRMHEVEEAGDVYRLRLVRIQRTIHKMRLERAFLLEQVAKRTSTNVEDSEGSPSPPPTPKEKPLRIKRGHRKPSFLNNLGDGRASSSFVQQGQVTLSPSSDAFSHGPVEGTAGGRPKHSKSQHPSKRPLPSITPTNGHASGASPSRLAQSSFEMYCNDRRGSLTTRHRKEIASGTFNVEDVLSAEWTELDASSKEEYERKFSDQTRSSDAERLAGDGNGGASASGLDTQKTETMDRDEDVEMADDAEESAGGGFTAINRG